MNLLSSLRKAVSQPREIGRSLMSHTAKYWRNDRQFLELMFYFKMGYKLDLNNPKSFNEKLQWLKLYNRNPEYTLLVDKYEVKKIVADKIGKEYIIPTIGRWDNPNDIDWEMLPESFVLKTTHGGGSTGVVICKDKKMLDKSLAKNKLQLSMDNNIYVTLREWPYKNVKRQIIAETFLSEGEGIGLHDYKILCFEGEPKLIEFHSGRFTSNQHQDIYDINWNLTGISQGGHYCSTGTKYPKPTCLNKMIELTRILCKDMHHVRIDWYIVNDSDLKFGEITFFDGSGFEPFNDYNDDLKLGSWIKIP